jgi:hypothetical protein
MYILIRNESLKEQFKIKNEGDIDKNIVRRASLKRFIYFTSPMHRNCTKRGL